MNGTQNFDALVSRIDSIPRFETDGFICATSTNSISVQGLNAVSRVGDLVKIYPSDGPSFLGEIQSFSGEKANVSLEQGIEGLALSDRVRHFGSAKITPDPSWLGRIMDPFLRPLDGKPLVHGRTEMKLKASAPPAGQRKSLGPRIHTGLAAVDTMLPFVRGQRMGIFAGSGVGKSTLLADFAKGVDADVKVVALVGERGREVKEFLEVTLSPDDLAKTIVIVATSDQPAMVRRRAAWVAMSIAEFFRDQGLHAFFLVDSITRFAEAHREIAIGSGENSGPGGFPPSTNQELMALCERAGPGKVGSGDISAIFSVLVEGSDMDGLIADVMRGILDGHLVLSRSIAERGRFPAIDLVRSLSRSTPIAASDEEQSLMQTVKHLVSEYESSETMIKAGLYTQGTDALIDKAIQIRPRIESFLSRKDFPNTQESFRALSDCVSEDNG